MKAIFVTGSDTGVGKTVITGLLAKYILMKNGKVITQKWIETGATNFSKDVQTHLKLMGIAQSSIENNLACLPPYVFKTVCSPHLASKIEKKRISAAKIKENFRKLSAKFDFVIVEGTGGLLVPFSQDKLIADIVKDLNLEVLVVIKNKLGAINHALLTLEALRLRKLKILGLVFNNARNEPKIILKDNPRIIKKLTSQNIFGVLPWLGDYDKLCESFCPIADKIWKKIKQ
jgi:dethiobiotin synthetase